MEKISIVNHSVRVNNLDLLHFMYPDYITLDKPVIFTDKNIIFTGETKYINRIKSLGVNYIFVSATGEYNLTKRDVLLQVAFNHWNRDVPKYVQGFQNDLEDNLFIDTIKYLWITGKWPIKSYDNVGAFLSLLQSFKTDTYTISKTYLQLLDKVGAEYIEMSLLTFLNRVVNPSTNISKWYKQLLDEYRCSKKDLIRPAIDSYLKSDVYSSEIRIFNLILNLNRRYG